MRELVSGVLRIGDSGADFLVVLPPGPFLTFFRLVLRYIGRRSRGGEGTLTYAVDNCPDSGEIDVMVSAVPVAVWAYSLAASAILYVAPGDYFVAEVALNRHDS